MRAAVDLTSIAGLGRGAAPKIPESGRKIPLRLFVYGRVRPLSHPASLPARQSGERRSEDLAAQARQHPRIGD